MRGFFLGMNIVEVGLLLLLLVGLVFLLVFFTDWEDKALKFIVNVVFGGITGAGP